MTNQELIQKIRYRFGAPVVEVEATDPQLLSIIGDCIVDLQPYMTNTSFISVASPVEGPVDLSAYDVENIVNVYQASSAPSDILDSILPFNNNPIENRLRTTLDVNNLSVAYLRTQIANTIKNPISFKWIAPKLYVDQGYPKSANITVEINKKISDVASITEDYWLSYMLRLSIARTKVLLGRIRGKYTMSNLPYQLDAPALLAEGTAEEKEILDEIKASSTDAFYML